MSRPLARTAAKRKSRRGWSAIALRGVFSWIALLFAGTSHGLELTGYLGVEGRGFLHNPRSAEQKLNSASVVLRPELYHAWAEDRQSVTFTPFLRLDSSDAARSHFDVRELLWRYVAERFELATGIGHVFWGVTESQHLVDVINQTDLVEDIDGEDKLGQPMVNLSLILDRGTIDLFVLPGFRERTFPGRSGRLRTEPPVDADRAIYESSTENRHIDAAVRWSDSIGDWDIGLSHFYGTTREPVLVPDVDAAGAPVLLPRYDLVHQTGLDVQATKGSWLWKLEAIRRTGQGDAFLAGDAGFEYTYTGVFDSNLDIGVLFEYLHDTRGSGSLQPFENDVFAAARFVFNDEQSTEVLAGIVRDVNSPTTLFNIEASRRLGDRWKLELRARLWSGAGGSDPFASLSRDDHVQLSLNRFF